MLYSALITDIAYNSHADPESQYTDKIKQKFLDAVVELSPTASIDNIKELVKSQGYTVQSGSITLNDDFVKIVSIKSRSQEVTKYTFVQITAEMWDRLGSDTELDPNINHCFYFVDGRVVKFYVSTTGNINTHEIDTTYISYPTQWSTTDGIDMYTRYSSVFIEACKKLAVGNMVRLLRGEQNDME